MARMARIVVPGIPHHVTQRGNRRQTTFFCLDDYRNYIRLLKKYSKRANTKIWAYCLMPNHVHLVMVPENEDGLRMTLGEAHRNYTRYVNFREGWRGHLWQERFHSFPMDENHLLSAVRYIEQNPVAAKLCTSAEHWRWSSAIAHIENKSDGLVDIEPMLGRITDWRNYLSDTKDSDRCSELLAAHSRTGRPLGDTTFIKKLEDLTGRTLQAKRPGPSPVNKS